ncbi:MAG: efflux RND transporter periplasmic adaptor subunit [Candidatus Hydrogenedens sp.]|jgi:RND family efflux transporter MFP subunit|nr:efflux RND transporter periplasmic adaptor subunit [Candidatus Hydrogenedens sp.]
MKINKWIYGSTLLLLGLGLSLSACSPKPQGVAAQEQAVKTVSIRVTPVEKRLFEEKITAQGTLSAKNTAMVTPLIDGNITEFFVDVGDVVEAGKTKLFQIDKFKVERALAISEQSLAMARSAEKDAQAQLASVQAQYDKAKLDFERYSRLYNEKAITPDAMEKVDSGFQVASAGLERAKVGVAVTAEQTVQAEAALAISQKTCEDSLIYAPMNGVVSARMKEEGEFGPAGQPLIRIVDRNLLELSVFLPAEFYSRIVAEETKLHLQTQEVDLGAFPVSFKSPEIQPTLRTFEVRCLIPDPPDTVAPGALVTANAVLVTREALGVPTPAIQQRAGKEQIYTVADKAARGMEVTRGLETAGWTEVLNDSLTEGMPIITMGQFMVEEGSLVRLSEEGA